MIKKISQKLGIQHWKLVALYLVAYDAIAVILAYFFALWVRFDGHYTQIPGMYFYAWLYFAPIYSVFSVIIFWICRLYKSIWRFAGFTELKRVTLATGITFMFHTVFITLIFCRMPISYYCIGGVIQFLLVLGIRFSYRFILMERDIRGKGEGKKRLNNIMIIGAGEAGKALIRDIAHAREIEGRVVCIIDDNVNKHGRDIDGIPVVGDRYSILRAAREYDVDMIYISIPSAKPKDRAEILGICKNSGCKMRSLPGLYQIAKGEITVSKLKDVSLEDLMGREPVKINTREVFDNITGRVVLVTGGGGSIGTELSRQIAAQSPKTLILFDIYENNVYEIQLELRSKYPNLNLVVLVGSVRDSRKLFKVFSQYRPDIVYHAAAHKHVPLMEDSPCEAIKNNVIGTYKTAYAAMAHNCSQFVLISTDKAVNPTNIMGASKRLCEMILQAFNAMILRGQAKDIPQLFTHDIPDMIADSQIIASLENAKTKFVGVRFGNVLGSNGSAVPLFKKQIEKGGPVTVTHPDITRFFMTIPEAVSLVLQAGVYARGGEIFVLDMGEPVKIDDMVRNLINLSGLRPDVDIKIEYIGLRPGEKLYEEKLMAEEGLLKTENELIHIGKPLEFDIDIFLSDLEELMNMAYKNRSDIRDMVAKMVTTYKPM